MIEVDLALGDGLVMNCKIDIPNQIKLSDSEKDFTTMLKIFLKQLYEAKEAQIDKTKAKWEKLPKQ